MNTDGLQAAGPTRHLIQGMFAIKQALPRRGLNWMKIVLEWLHKLGTCGGGREREEARKAVSVLPPLIRVGVYLGGRFVWWGWGGRERLSGVSEIHLSRQM